MEENFRVTLGKRCCWIGIAWMLAGGPVPLDAQIVARPHFDFEYVSWGETPSFIQTTLGLTWMPDYGHLKYENLGSGRDDIFPLVTNIKGPEAEYFILFEFTQEDSALVSVTMLAASFAYMLSVPDEFLDYIWEMNLERFGESTGGKWIPLIGESKEWTQERVAIKMIRMYLPSTGVLVKYVLREEGE